MSYTVKWHPNAFKVLKKLPRETIQRITEKFDAAKLEPFRYLEHYEGKNLYKLRIGDYRALVEVDFKEKLILVKVFDHRGRIYKQLLS